MSKKENLGKNVILNIIKTCTTVLFPLITYPYISRVLQPANIGKFNFSSSYVNYFSLLASLGISTYAIRECSKYRENKEELSKVSSEFFSINLYTTIFAYLVLAITLIFFDSLSSYKTLIIILSTSILFTTIGVDWVNTVMGDFSFLTIRTIVFQIVSIMLMFIFVKDTNDYVNYAIITTISSSGANIVNYFYIKRYCNIQFTNKINWGKHLKPILFLFVMLLAQSIFSNLDITMLGLIVGDYEVGLYSTAVKITNIVSQIPVAILWVYLPRLTTQFKENAIDELNKTLKAIFNIVVTLSFPCVAGCICLSKEIVIIIGGEAYLGSQIPLCVLMLFFFVKIFGEYFLGNMILLPGGKEKKFMQICILTVIIDAVFNLFLIPNYGATGASAATLLAGIITLPFYYHAKPSFIELAYIKDEILKPLIGCGAIVLICYICKIVLFNLFSITFGSITLSIISYFFIELVLNNTIVVEVKNTIKIKLTKK